MREEFEKLPEIAARLNEYNIVFHENDYAAEGYSDNVKLWIAVGFVSGAWYAYQEQQKIINMQECGATEIRMILEDSEYDDSAKLERISELLK